MQIDRDSLRAEYERDADEKLAELQRLSEDVNDERMGLDDVDPATMALAEAAARGEVVVTVDRNGQIHATPVVQDAGPQPR